MSQVITVDGKKVEYKVSLKMRGEKRSIYTVSYGIKED